MRKSFDKKQIERMWRTLRLEGLLSIYTLNNLKVFSKEELALMLYHSRYLEAFNKNQLLIDSIWSKIEGDE